MHNYNNSLPKFQSISEISAATIFGAQTAAGKFLTERYRIHPDIADLLARIAGLGSEEVRT